MEKRVAKIEADQADMKMLLVRVADSLLELVSEVGQIRSGLADVKSELSDVRAGLADMRQADAERHKETIGFLSKHNK